eukprot:626379-Hanusia_phi.AAC.1
MSIVTVLRCPAPIVHTSQTCCCVVHRHSLLCYQLLSPLLPLSKPLTDPKPLSIPIALQRLHFLSPRQPLRSLLKRKTKRLASGAKAAGRAVSAWSLRSARARCDGGEGSRGRAQRRRLEWERGDFSAS